MATASNTLLSQVHGQPITSANSAIDGTPLTTSAGTTAVQLLGDKSHYGMSMKVGAITAGQSRPVALPISTAAQSSTSASIHFMPGGIPTGATAVLAGLVSSTDILVATVQLTTAGVVVLATRGGTKLTTTTSKLDPFTPYRLDFTASGIGTTAGTIKISICDPAAAAHTALAPDLTGTLTNVDLSTGGITHIKSLQFGYIQGGGGMPESWWWAPRADEGTTTPVVSWMPAVAIGESSRSLTAQITAGTATASGIRSGDTAPVNVADVSGAVGDGDAATVATIAAGSTLLIDMGMRVLSGDLTVTLDGFTGSATATLLIDGVAKGAAKTAGPTVKWTRAEQGSPAANSAHRIHVKLVG